MPKIRIGAIGVVLLAACGSGAGGTSADPAGSAFAQPNLPGSPPDDEAPPSGEQPPPPGSVPGGSEIPGAGGGGGQGGSTSCVPACESALQRCATDAPAEVSCEAICAELTPNQVACLSLPCEEIDACIEGGTGGTGGTGGMGGMGGSGGGGNLDCMTVCTDCGFGAECSTLCGQLNPTQEQLQCLVDNNCNGELCFSTGTGGTAGVGGSPACSDVGMNCSTTSDCCTGLVCGGDFTCF